MRTVFSITEKERRENRQNTVTVSVSLRPVLNQILNTLVYFLLHHIKALLFAFLLHKEHTTSCIGTESQYWTLIMGCVIGRYDVISRDTGPFHLQLVLEI